MRSSTKSCYGYPLGKGCHMEIQTRTMTSPKETDHLETRLPLQKSPPLREATAGEDMAMMDNQRPCGMQVLSRTTATAAAFKNGSGALRTTQNRSEHQRHRNAMNAIMHVDAATGNSDRCGWAQQVEPGRAGPSTHQVPNSKIDNSLVVTVIFQM